MNRLCEILNIKYPIFQGGMGNISNAQLTSAVSEAGGLGTIGSGTMTPEELEKVIIETKERTSKPFAVNVAITVTPYLEAIMKVIVKHQVPVVSLSAGNPAPFIPKLHDKGIKVITVVGTVKQAKKAQAAGTDVIVAEGFEAAGINSNLETTTMTLIPQIAVNIPEIPLVAAGGIGDGSGLAAAIALGANGVQMGTRFIATKEAPFHDNYKQKILNANDEETFIVGRKVGRTRRVMNTPYAQNLIEQEKSEFTLEQFSDLTSETYHKIGALEGDFIKGYVNGGQIAGLLTNIPSVSELIETMVLDALKQSDRIKNNLMS